MECKVSYRPRVAVEYSDAVQIIEIGNNCPLNRASRRVVHFHLMEVRPRSCIVLNEYLIALSNLTT
jgi:hypothetical protein